MLLAVSTAATVAWLTTQPLRVSPNDDLALVLVPALVAFGMAPAPFVLAGCFLGLVGGELLRPQTWSRTAAIEEGTALSAAALPVVFLPLPAVPFRLGSLVICAVVYTLVRTALVAIRVAREERVAWWRACGIVGTATGPFLAIPVILSLVTVVIDRLWLPHASRLAVSMLPLVGGTVALHVFHPHSMRGREEQRVLAFTAVLADAMDVKDTLTGLHSQAVAQLSKQIARALKVNERLVHQAFLTGLLHDVGKVAVPDAILQKPGRLEPDEWRVMRQHVLDSAAMVESITGLAQIVPLVRASHEHYDGSGYPEGLRDDAIPLGARIVAGADAYHALTNDRVYRPRHDREVALAELDRCSGTQFDPGVVQAIRAVTGGEPRVGTAPASRGVAAWLTLLRRPAFALLWGGELVSFLGDEVFFIAITLWVYTLTGSAVMLAGALAAGYAGQAAFSVLAGVVADRVDRRLIVAVSDVGRALVVAALPFVLPRSLPGALVLLALLSVGSAFFRGAVNALVPSIAAPEELETAVALYQTTERIAEIAGGVLGGAAVLVVGYSAVMFADAASFLVSATCVLSIPLAWGAGLGVRRAASLGSDLAAGLRYLWRTPFQRYFALLIVPGYLTLAFDALRAPMVVRTAHLSAEAYGVINSATGAGRLVTALVLAGITRRWATPYLGVVAYLVTALGVAIFTALPWYLGMVVGAFIFAAGNMLSYIVNATLIMQVTPQALLGRVLGNRQVLVQGTRLISVLALGRLADATTPPVALWVMVILSVAGVLALWLLSGRVLPSPTPASTLESNASVPDAQA